MYLRVEFDKNGPSYVASYRLGGFLYAGCFFIEVQSLNASVGRGRVSPSIFLVFVRPLSFSFLSRSRMCIFVGLSCRQY